MSDVKRFIQERKLKKSEDLAYKGFLCFGDKVQMYNNLYKVISHKKQFTILEDEKKSKIALPTDKLSKLFKDGLAINHGQINLQKALKPSATPSSSEGHHGKPIGTVTMGADGSSYKKVSDNPSQWVKVSVGSVHSSPGGEEEHVLSQHEFQAVHKKVLGAILSDTPKEAHPKLEKMLNEWLSSKKKAAFYKKEVNTSEVGEGGKKEQKVHPGGKIQEHAKLEREAMQKYADLKQALKAAKIKG